MRECTADFLNNFCHITKVLKSLISPTFVTPASELVAEAHVIERVPCCVKCVTHSSKCGGGCKNVTNKNVIVFENAVSAVGSEFCAVRSVSVLVPSGEEMHTALE